jgi:glycosyltransferase involved in cell wall biosynthesis
MRILMLGHSNGGGGAGRAAGRLFRALDDVGADLRMHVDFKDVDDPRVNTNTGPLAEQRRSVRIHADEIPAVLAGHPHPELFSPGRRSALSARQIDAMGADITDVHWTNFGYLSVEQMGAIRTPLVWHIHDMWAFTGGENYTDDGPQARWRSGYRTPSPYPLRWDVERWVYSRKVRHWHTPRHLIASSTWMANMAQGSPLTQEWPVTLIPNPIDTETYTPGDQRAAREALHLPPHTPLVVVLLPTRLDDPRKGFDLLVAAMQQVHAGHPDIELAVVGHAEPPATWPTGMPRTHWLGRQDDAGCIAAYRAADVVVVPSRQDNSPQTATEALSCGTPVVAFRTTGLPDFVDHEVTGFLAEPESAADLAAGIAWVLDDTELRDTLSRAARTRAVEEWSFTTVARRHLDLYAEILDGHAGKAHGARPAPRVEP